MNALVVSSLLPVVILIAIGFIASRAKLMGAEGIKDLSSLVFVILTPALLFRTMSSVHVEQLNFVPVASYFVAVAVVFIGILVVQGFSRYSSVLALAATFSNTVMIGIPLVSLAYGHSGLVILLTLVSVHALVLLTSATVVLELAVAREAAKSVAGGQHHPVQTVLLAARNAILHPVPLPILAGLMFAQTGWTLPAEIDKVLAWMGSAFGPLALLLVGMTLAGKSIGAYWKGALALAVAKNVVMPVLVAVAGYALGVTGLPLTVMVVAASLPIGANVFLFSQRYAVGQEVVTAAVGLSSVLSLVTLSLVMAWVGAT
jgi:predicted permease